MTLWPELPAASGDVPSASTSQVIRQPRPPPSRGPTFSPRRGPLSSSFVTPPAPTHRRRQFGPQSNDSVLASNEMNSLSSLDREWLYMDTLRSSYSSNNARAMPRRRRNAISGSDRPGRERIRTTNLPDTVQQFLRENNSEELADEYRRWLVEQHISDPDQRVPTVSSHNLRKDVTLRLDHHVHHSRMSPLRIVLTCEDSGRRRIYLQTLSLL